MQNEAVDTSNPPTNAKVEHPIDLQVHVRFTESANLGRRPSGAPSNTPALSTQFFLTAYFSNTGLPAGLPRVAADSPNLRRPEQCVWEAYGSYMNSRNFILTAAELNSVKGQLFGLTFPIRDNRYCQLVRDSIAGNRTSTNVFLQGLRAVGPVPHTLCLDEMTHHLLTSCALDDGGFPIPERPRCVHQV